MTRPPSRRSRRCSPIFEGWPDGPDAVVGVLRDGEVTLAARGELAEHAEVRISSMTKPVVAWMTVGLLDDLAQPIDPHVPELAGRGITVEHLLTMRSGYGYPGDHGYGYGPPKPEDQTTADEWLARLAHVEPHEPPGTRWRYEASFAILGVLLERATGTPLDELLHEHVCRPLEMDHTAFVSAHLPVTTFDEGGDASRWAQRPAFHDACGGLVSTAEDYLRFAAAVLEDDRGITRDRLPADQHGDPFLDGGGWGYGVGVHPDRYGWAGGLGTLWWTWPGKRTAAVLLTQQTPPHGPTFAAFTRTIA